MLTLFNGIQIASGIFFQAIGKPAKSAFLTLSRQILFFTSAAIILSNIFGVMGVLYAGPVSDGLAFLVSATLLIFERRSLNKKEKEVISDSENIAAEKVEANQPANKNIIITIAREYGSGGRYVGKLLSEKLGIKLYDKSLISLVSDESGLSAEYIEENEQTINGKLLANFNSQYYNNLSNDDNLFIAESNAIKEIASKESCIIVGRCADYILKNNDNVFSVFLYNSDESKVNRAVKYYGLNEKNALKEIQKINKSRENHYKYYTNKNWRDMSNYSLAINVDTFGVEKTADIIKESIKSLDNKKYQVV